MKYLYMFVMLVLMICVFNRKFDFLSMAAIGFVIYTINSVSGKVWIPKGTGIFYYNESIGFKTYAIVILQLIIILIYILISDKIRIKPISIKIKGRKRVSNKKTDSFVYSILLAIVIITILVTITTLGTSLLSMHKSEIAENTTIFYTLSLWVNMTILAYAIDNKSKYHIIGSTFGLIVFLFLGSRSLVAVAIVLILVLKWSNLRQGFINNLKIYSIGTILASGLFIYKEIYRDVKSLNMSEITSKLLNYETYINGFKLKEPSIVMSIYDYVIQTDYKLSGLDSVARLFSIVPFANEFIDTKNNIRFSYIVKNEFFGAGYGLASNFWGEAYAMFNYFGVILFTVLWLLLLSYGNKIVYSSKKSKYVILVFTSYISFYIHRLDFIQVIGAFKSLLLCYLLYSLLYYIVSSILPKKTIQLNNIKE